MDKPKANTWPVVDFPGIAWVDTETPPAVRLAARYRAQKDVFCSFKYMLLHNEAAPAAVRILTFIIGILLTLFFYDWFTTLAFQWASQFMLLAALFVALFFHYAVFIVMQRVAYASLAKQYHLALKQQAKNRLIFSDTPAWKCLLNESYAYNFSRNGVRCRLLEVVGHPACSKHMRHYLLAVQQIPDTNNQQMALLAQATLHLMREEWYQQQK